jgi:hypothetical protein
MNIISVCGFAFDVVWLCNNFKQLLYFESRKHVDIVTSSFSEFVGRILLKSKTQEIVEMFRRLLGTLVGHMSPAFASGHRLFVLQVANDIIAVYPEAVQPSLLFGIASLLWDNRTQLVSMASQSIVKPPQSADLFQDLNNDVINRVFVPKQSAMFDISPLLTQLEQQPELFKELIKTIDRGDQHQHQIQMAGDAVFNVLLGTRKLGIVAQGQPAFETLGKLLDHKAVLVNSNESTSQAL